MTVTTNVVTRPTGFLQIPAEDPNYGGYVAYFHPIDDDQGPISPLEFTDDLEEGLTFTVDASGFLDETNGHTAFQYTYDPPGSDPTNNYPGDPILFGSTALVAGYVADFSSVQPTCSVITITDGSGSAFVELRCEENDPNDPRIRFFMCPNTGATYPGNSYDNRPFLTLGRTAGSGCHQVNVGLVPFLEF